MEDRLQAYRERRERVQEYKDTAARSCYSLIIIVVALVLLRPMMVNQILGLASAYSSVGLLDESMRQCDKALLIDGNSCGAWCQSARVYKAQGDRDMAYTMYQKAVQADPSDPTANLELASMYIEDRQHQLAIPHLEQVRTLGPDKVSVHSSTRPSYHLASLEMLIRCYEKENDTAKMEVALKETRIFYPNSHIAQSSLLQLPGK